jgi:hypothetical protein
MASPIFSDPPPGDGFTNHLHPPWGLGMASLTILLQGTGSYLNPQLFSTPLKRDKQIPEQSFANYTLVFIRN